MADEADHAQVYEERERMAAIEAAMHRTREDPLIVNGVLVCRGCGDGLSAERLRARPDATRCVPCQEELECGR